MLWTVFLTCPQVAGFRQQSADVERGLLLNIVDKLHVRYGRLSVDAPTQ
jgi:hypothetical protein